MWHRALKVQHHLAHMKLVLKIVAFIFILTMSYMHTFNALFH
jgi:hypothetical protein